MSSINKIAFWASVLAYCSQSLAENTGICHSNPCDDCPGSITSSGSGYPNCVTYDTDRVLTGAGGGFDNNKVWFDIGYNDPGCKTIIRSPAGNEYDECGTSLISSSGDQCLPATLDSTFLVQFCCGTGGSGSDCAAAGVDKRAIRGTTNVFEKRKTKSFTSQLLTDAEGKYILPKSVGEPKELGGADKFEEFIYDLGLSSFSNSTGPLIVTVGADRSVTVKRESPAPLKKRQSCSYSESGRGSKTGDVSYKLSGDFCYPDSFSETNTRSISHTTSFSASISDPFGIVSTSVGFMTTKSQSQSHMYTVNAVSGTCGFAQWTPYFICSEGTISCDDGTTEDGEVCTAKMNGKNDDYIDGKYSYVVTGNGPSAPS